MRYRLDRTNATPRISGIQIASFENAKTSRRYRPLPTSPAIDFAPASNTLGTDIDRQPRNADIVGSANRYGPRDLGAYEYQAGRVLDRVFLGVFE